MICITYFHYVIFIHMNTKIKNDLYRINTINIFVIMICITFIKRKKKV